MGLVDAQGGPLTKPTCRSVALDVLTAFDTLWTLQNWPESEQNAVQLHRCKAVQRLRNRRTTSWEQAKTGAGPDIRLISQPIFPLTAQQNRSVSSLFGKPQGTWSRRRRSFGNHKPASPPSPRGIIRRTASGRTACAADPLWWKISGLRWHRPAHSRH